MNSITVPCLCSAAHPDGDTVTFRATLDFRTMAIFQHSISWQRSQDPDQSIPEILATLTEMYLLHCIESWTLGDEKGKPLPVSKANIRTYVLEKPEQAFQLADFADGLYTERVLLPLVNQASRSSRTTPTNGSTSATPPSGTSRKPSKRSSTTTSRTDGIAATPA